MDSKAKFFARMEANLDAEKNLAWPGGKQPDEVSDTSELDIDFAITESGRTTVGGLAAGALDDMDFSVCSSGRTIENVYNSWATTTERSGVIGMSERSGLASLGENSILTAGASSNADDDDDDDDSAIVRPMDTSSMRGAQLEQLQQQIQQQQQEDEKGQPQQQPQQQQELGYSDAVLQAPHLPQFQNQPFNHSQQARSQPMAIPKPSTPQLVPASLLSSGRGSAPPSQPSSVGSSGSNFLNNIITPSATTFNNTQISHTPPTHLATSYEASHFGKRRRADSVSERLRFPTELEEKGLIDRQQKEIIKDLIISGDNDLQKALDEYEKGNPAVLENMIEGGALSSRAAADIDLLGDLDLDFLTVNDTDGVDNKNPQNVATTAGMQGQPTYQTSNAGNAGLGGYQVPGGAMFGDGIGELEFAGDYVNMPSHVTRGTSPPPMDQADRRPRSDSTWSFRPRSDSTIAMLLGGSPTIEMGGNIDYGRWMEMKPEPQVQGTSRRASAPGRPSNLSISMSEQQNEDDMAVEPSAPTQKETKAEARNRIKQEKKEQRERERREKKEKREQAKLEKQQKKLEMEAEKLVHVPGSGRPRSLSDSNLKTTVDDDGLLQVERPEGWIGAYSPESRKARIERFMEKRKHRVWTQGVKYDVRKNFADSRLRVKGRFVKKEDELLMRELMSLT